MNWNYSDLMWEIEKFGSLGFKFYMKILLYYDDYKDGKEIIYAEFIATKDMDKEKYPSDYIDYTNIHYYSQFVEASMLKKFVESCYLYKKINFMIKKEKIDDSDKIRKKLKYEYEKDKELFDYFLEADDEYPSFISINSRDISLQNLNIFSECKFYESDPLDYDINKDSSIDYYQLDFGAQARNLNEFNELLHSAFDYYKTIYDFIYHKFGKNFTNEKRLLNSILFVLPKDHFGKVKVDLVGNTLTAKLTNLTSEELQLKLQAKNSDTGELQHIVFNFDDKNLEKEVVLDFIPDMLDGYLLDYIDEYPDYKIQKICRRYSITESILTNEKYLREIIRDGEGLKTDFKLMYPHKDKDKTKKKDQSIIREICSFANADGGVIIFGVKDEDASIEGYDVKNQFKSEGDFEQHIQNLCNKKLEPPVIAKIHKTEIDKKTLQIVQIFPNEEYVRLVGDKKIIVRKGSTARETYPGEIKKPKMY